MVQEIEYTDQFGIWWDPLDVDAQASIAAAVGFLAERGPALSRPLVDSIKQSRHPNMNELRPPNGNIRILFAFDPRRMAILLIGGDKSGQWRRWYDDMVPRADALYDDHLESLRKEGLIL
ncbi:MAG: type II toxin-antitoxin system RelE/ParE family toxin [Thermomicrobiales bacterium]|nr:type II toxin-antitoxin system RelE/ParE family toxin [Thermomicrobiales bacterium]